MLPYRTGWIIDRHVAALIHVAPDFTPEHFDDINGAIEAIGRETDHDFHVVIDASRMNLAHPLSFDDWKRMYWALNHHHNLRHIVVILPTPLFGRSAVLPTENHGNQTLKYVDTQFDAFAYLKDVDPSIDWRSLRDRRLQ